MLIYYLLEVTYRFDYTRSIANERP